MEKSREQIRPYGSRGPGGRRWIDSWTHTPAQGNTVLILAGGILVGLSLWLIPTFPNDESAAREVVATVLAGLTAVWLASSIFRQMLDNYRMRKLESMRISVHHAETRKELSFLRESPSPHLEAEPEQKPPAPSLPLVGVDLREAALPGADLTHTELTDARLKGADLNAAKLSESQLAGADLRRADLRFADLRSSDLSEALLDGAKLEGADLRGASGLAEASLAGATYDDATTWPSSELSPADLGAVHIDEIS